MKVVYENRSGRLGISYTQFTRYVDRIVRAAARSSTQVRPSLSPAAADDPLRLGAFGRDP